MTASARVKKLLTEMDDRSEDERTELELALLVQDPTTGREWASEIDMRAERVSNGAARGLSRAELETILALPRDEARARLAAILSGR